jgi:glycosyltransferase involved in cell wall biosynthesis
MYINRHFGVFGIRHLNYKFVYAWHNLRVRDLLANQASFGRFDADDLFELVADQTKNPTLNFNPKEFQPVLLLELARLAALQPITETDLDRAYSTYNFVFKNYPNWKRLPSTRVHPAHDFVYLFACAATKRFESWESFTTETKLGLLAEQVVNFDKHHPRVAGAAFNKAVWVEKFNEIFNIHNLEPVSFLETNNDIESINLDSIVCYPQDQVDGKLVTVVVSTYNPGQELITSIRSLVNQSWKNLEILLVDDFSQDSTFIELALSMDTRIQLIRQEKNQGTYAARNAALDVASGDFITFQDSDDWSHPRRIEAQIAAFGDTENVMATYAKAVRLPSDLFFTGADSIPWRETNASSLMFRYCVFEELGYFDSVRKAADSEYFSRINSYYKNKSNVAPIQLCSDAHLSIIRISQDSLSRSEIRTNWMHPVRYHYRDSFNEWHKSCSSKGVTPYVPKNLTERKFPCPNRFEIDPISPELDTCDLVIAVDSTSVSAPVVSMIEDAISSGYSVSLLNLLPESRNETFGEVVRTMIANFQVRLITMNEQMSCKILIIGNARLFQFPSPLPWNIYYDEICFVSDEIFIKRIEKLESIKTQSLRGALGYFDQPIEVSKIKKHAPVDLTQATWFSDNELHRESADALSMKLVPFGDFDLTSALGKHAKG